jgi:hypothetical protein
MIFLYRISQKLIDIFFVFRVELAHFSSMVENGHKKLTYLIEISLILSSAEIVENENRSVSAKKHDINIYNPLSRLADQSLLPQSRVRQMIGSCFWRLP